MALGRFAAGIVGTWGLWASVLIAGPGAGTTATMPAEPPPPPGSLVDLGGHRLHLHCSGRAAPVVVIENGLGDFSFDWIGVQGPLARTGRFILVASGHAMHVEAPATVAGAVRSVVARIRRDFR